MRVGFMGDDDEAGRAWCRRRKAFERLLLTDEGASYPRRRSASWSWSRFVT
jgi:hypothetical protein